MATYNKTMPGEFVIEQLEKEINENSVIVPALQHITADGQDIVLEFTASLSEPEDTELNSVITNHVPDMQTIDVATLPLSDLDGKKLSVHPSYKPITNDGKATYAVWTSCGDELDGSNDLIDPPTGKIGEGPLVHFDLTDQMSTQSIFVKFHPDHGRVWLHEAYIRTVDAPEDVYTSAEIHAEATPLQTLSNLDLEITDDWIHLAAGGPGTGTHGFADADAITLVPRTFSGDGHWDYDGTNLTPNTGGTGKYRISNTDRVVHRFVNRLSLCGTIPYFSITSDETTELPKGYYLEIKVATVDGSNFATAWHMSVIMEIYRQRTYLP